MGRRRYDHGIELFAQQRIEIGNGVAAERAGDELPLLAVGVGYTGQFDAGHFRKHPRMVTAHDADAHHADPQFSGLTHVATLALAPERAPHAAAHPIFP